MSEEKYVIVTAVSMFRMRYCIPVSELQKMNPEVPVEAVQWAEDSVTMNEAEEFSQLHLGETIIDTMVVDEEAMLSLFDKDNGYLSGWTREKKIDFVRDWKTKT